MQALIRALEHRGWPVTVKERETQATVMGVILITDLADGGRDVDRGLQRAPS